MPVIYEIRIEGQLNPGWSDWLDGMTITLLEGNQTLLSGPLADQAAMLGLLMKLHNFCMLLLAVKRCPMPVSE
jgi:hypothetical protein